MAWKRLLEIKPYIDILVTTLPFANDADSKRDGQRLSEIMLTKDEWVLLADLCEVLSGFAEATTYLGASKYVTHSVMNPLLKEIKKRVKPKYMRFQGANNMEEITDIFEEEEEGEQAECENTSERRLDLNEPFGTIGMLEKVKLDLYNAMELYWNKENEKILISAILDPRIKFLGFIDNEEIRNKTKDLLKNKYDQLKTNSLSTIPTTSPQLTSNQSSLFSIFKQNSTKEEVAIYLSLPELDFNFDPFVWWRDHKERFPILSKLARIYLPIPATSTPSERLFSDAGNLLTAKRTRLNPELFNRLMFLKKNASFVKSIHPPKKSDM